MAFASVAALLEALRQTPLLESAQMAELTAQPAARFSDPRALAGELVRRGWLTPYQVNQLFQGRANRLILGPFVLLERLGEGGMGEVFKARAAETGTHRRPEGHPQGTAGPSRRGTALPPRDSGGGTAVTSEYRAGHRRG